MSNKRKNTSIQSSWEETKAQLQQDFQFGWLNELSKVQTSLLSERDGLKKDAAEKKRVLDDQLQQEQSAFSQESNDVYKLVEKIQDLKADVADIEQAISEIRDVETEVRANIRLYKQEASQRLQEIDVVEMERMAEVPKIKNQISLYATTTGIKWDYNREHVLAGEVAIPSLGIVTRFSIDPREHDDFQIANYLWSAMEGDISPAIKASS